MRSAAHFPPLLILLLLATLSPAAEAPDDTLLVTGRTARPGAVSDTLGVGYFEDIFDRGGLAIIRKGFSLGGDVYADGFKRANLTTVVDGERVNNACPNRMDALVGRLNPLVVASVDIVTDGAPLQGGIGGMIAFRRARPATDPVLRGYLAGGLHRSAEMDAGLAFEVRGLRLGARHLRAGAYEDGDGRSFADLYGYSEEATSHHTEISLQQDRDDWTVHGAYVVSREIMHPYLLMDERESDHWSASFGRGACKVYIDHTDHLMDNGLRASGAAVDMVTAASNTDIGLNGGWFEVQIRNWDADNRITLRADPATGTVNHMLPDVWRWGATVRGEKAGPGGTTLYGRAGLVLSRAGDERSLDLHRRLHVGAGRQRVSAPFAAGLRLDGELRDGLDSGLLVESVADAPGLEELYIGVDKPGTKPTWIGNPDLGDPLRGTLRGSLASGPVRLESFVTHAVRYPYLVKRVDGADGYQTYAGEDVLLAGASIFASWDLLDITVDWQWGEKSDGTPMGEIPPLRYGVTTRTPVWRDWRGSLSWTHAEAQNRVDPTQDEAPTPAWDRLDLSLQLTVEDATLEIRVENLTDELYAEHLAYWRQVFGSNTPVHAPGRTVRVSSTFAL